MALGKIKADTLEHSTAGTVDTQFVVNGSAKHFVNYDAPNTTSDSSLNQSSLTDYATGEFKSNFTNSFSSAVDKVHITSTMNSADDGSNVSAARTRAGTNSGVGTLAASQAVEALSASGVQYFTANGSTGSADGAQIDLSASYILSMGDLA